MKKRTTRHPIPFNDPDGTPCVRVPLSNGKHFAELYADDYAALIARGITGNWQHTIPNRLSRTALRSYVQCHVPRASPCDAGKHHTALTVSRMILDAPKGRRIFYRDNNTLNLRRDNLQLREGYTRLERDALLPPVNRMNETIAGEAA